MITKKTEHRRRRPSTRIPPGAVDAKLLWTAPLGVRCVVARYDHTRYQLRLLREEGTIKADLFSDEAAAIAMAREWRRDIENR
jgi:hypothetical protein